MKVELFQELLNRFNLFQLSCATSDIILNLLKMVSISKSRMKKVQIIYQGMKKTQTPHA
jgi:hypothetical protein